ncbi:IclR family transcriptional regulator [Aquincola sp. MAHUQ-54]|uniref:IclR family transcriptional regulator n=1 Tax=Aquincola agrisoli TaxID=3119538 RepID=A0AAW9Q1F4_9BURK
MTAAQPLQPLSADLAEAVAGRGAPQIQSVVRALTILELLAAAGHPLALSELCSRAGLKPSTCHHLLGTLVARGYVRHDLRTRDYGLGGRMAELCAQPSEHSALLPLAQPAVRLLGTASGEAVHLATMQGCELVTLLKFDSTHAVRVDTGAVGKSQAAHATATGKALIAWWPRPQLDLLIERVALRRFTDRTITDAAQLHTHLAKVRRNGYAEDIEEFQPGVHCIGAPVRGADGGVVAAVSCSMPTMRANRRTAAQVRGLVLACTQEISHRLGHRPSGPTPSFAQ